MTELTWCETKNQREKQTIRKKRSNRHGNKETLQSQRGKTGMDRWSSEIAVKP